VKLTDAQLRDAAAQVITALACDEDGELEVRGLLAETVATRVRMPEYAWPAEDAAEAREAVGQLVAEWLRQEMNQQACCPDCREAVDDTGCACGANCGRAMALHH
jgi:hypothetical protein